MSALAIARTEFVARLRSDPPYLALPLAVGVVMLVALGGISLLSAAAPRLGPYPGSTVYFWPSESVIRTNLAAHRGEAMFFVTLSLAVLGLFLGPLAAGAVLNREQEKDALEALLLSGASPLAIVIGKLLASLGRTLLLIAAATPAATVSWLFGGVPAGSVLGAAAVIVALALLACAVGLLAASLLRSSVVAVLWSYATLALLVAVPPLLFIVLVWTGNAPSWQERLYYSSPVLTLWLHPDTLAAFSALLPPALQSFAQTADGAWQGIPLANVFLALTSAGYVLLAGLMALMSSVLLDPYHTLRGVLRRLRPAGGGR